MEAKKIVVQKEVEVVTTKLVDETNVTITLSLEDASKLRTLSYTVAYALATNPGTTAHVIFRDLFDTLCNADVPHARNNGLNFEQDFPSLK